MTNTGMNEDVAWYEYWFIRRLRHNKAGTTAVTATTTQHTKDGGSALAIPHGCNSTMTEDSEEAAASSHSGDPRRRSNLHEDPRDTGSRDEIPPGSRKGRSVSIEEAPKSGRGLPMVMPSSQAKTNSAAQLEQKLLHP
jgi:hypothetical protein